MMVDPEKIFKVGACRATVFRNEIMKNGKKLYLPKVVFQVRYKDKDGNWKGTSSMSINDLPKAILAMQKAYEYLTDKSAVSPTEPPIPKGKISDYAE